MATSNGYSFSSTDGLNTTSYTQCSLVFLVPTSVNLAINVGGHNGSHTGLAAQTAGTVFAYGWKIIYNNSTNQI